MESITVKVKILPFDYLVEEISPLQKELQIDIQKESNVHNLFVKLSEELGRFFQKYIYDPETLSLIQNTIVIVNGKVLRTLDICNTKLSDGDIVTIGRVYTGG